MLLGVVGYRKNATGWNDVPTSWLRGLDLSDEDVWSMQYEPNFTDMYYMDKWKGANFFRETDVKNWEVYKYPPGEAIVNSDNWEGNVDNSLKPTTLFSDGRSNTEWRTFWWRGNILNFPHVYEMDFSKTREINELRIGCSANQGLYPVDSEVEVRLAPYNYSIKAGNETIDCSPANCSLDHNQSIVFFGNLTKNKQYIAFDMIEKGRYLRVTFLNNRAIWKDNNKKVDFINRHRINCFQQESQANNNGATAEDKQRVRLCV